MTLQMFGVLNGRIIASGMVENMEFDIISIFSVVFGVRKKMDSCNNHDTTNDRDTCWMLHCWSTCRLDR